MSELDGRIQKNLPTAMVDSDKRTKINNTAISGEYLFFTMFFMFSTARFRYLSGHRKTAPRLRRHLNLKIGKDHDKQRLSQIGSSAFVRNESGVRDLTMPWHVFQYLAIMTFRRTFCSKSPHRIGNQIIQLDDSCRRSYTYTGRHRHEIMERP